MNDLGIERVGIISLIDFVEHLEKEEATALIKKTMARADRVLVFTPLGFDHQDGEDSYDFAKKNLQKLFTKEEKELAVKAQTHKSGWTAEDFETLGFDVLVNSNYHAKGEGAIWAQWSRDGGPGPQGPYR